MKELIFNENEFDYKDALDTFIESQVVIDCLLYTSKSKTLSLKSLNHNKSLVFHMEGFNHLGIWAAKHVGGLIAIEPWVGHSDYVGFTGEFKDKEGVVSLNPSEIFECTFKVEINQ